jgi:hypothetical protein
MKARDYCRFGGRGGQNGSRRRLPHFMNHAKSISKVLAFQGLVAMRRGRIAIRHAACFLMGR